MGLESCQVEGANERAAEQSLRLGGQSLILRVRSPVGIRSKMDCGFDC